MVGIEGLSGVPDPQQGQIAKVRGDRRADTGKQDVRETAAGEGDRVAISSEAKAAVEVMRILQTTREATEARLEKVAAARERIANGEYKNPDVVRKVAERLMKYLA